MKYFCSYCKKIEVKKGVLRCKECDLKNRCPPVEIRKYMLKNYNIDMKEDLIK